jgi:4-hydroxybenzoyl-CoA thioesterase
MIDASNNSIFTEKYTVSFGDCDPAGIVFYPNIYAWLDRTFHAYLRAQAGGHAAVCKALSARGVGVSETSCTFKVPLMEGNDFSVSIKTIDWGERFFRVSYQGDVDGRVAFEAYEDRALFVFQDGRLRAGKPTLLRDHLKK